MADYNPNFHDESTVEQVNEIAQEVSDHSVGDVVTLTPAEGDTSYYGSWLEGCKLTIEQFYRPRARVLVSDRQLAEWLDRKEERTHEQAIKFDTSEGPSGVNGHYVVVDGARWMFKEVDAPVDLSDQALQPWDDYYEPGMKIHLPPEKPDSNSNQKHYIRDSAATDECRTLHCFVCESAWIEYHCESHDGTWSRLQCGTCGHVRVERMS